MLRLTRWLALVAVIAAASTSAQVSTQSPGPRCMSECGFYAARLLACNAGRDRADSVSYEALTGLADDFRKKCGTMCAAAPGHRDGFTVSLKVDLSTPNRCAYDWAWCTPGAANSNCIPVWPRLCGNAEAIIIVQSQLCGDPDEAIH